MVLLPPSQTKVACPYSLQYKYAPRRLLLFDWSSLYNEQPLVIVFSPFWGILRFYFNMRQLEGNKINWVIQKIFFWSKIREDIIFLFRLLSMHASKETSHPRNITTSPNIFMIIFADTRCEFSRITKYQRMLWVHFLLTNQFHCYTQAYLACQRCAWKPYFEIWFSDWDPIQSRKWILKKWII